MGVRAPVPAPDHGPHDSWGITGAPPPPPPPPLVRLGTLQGLDIFGRQSMAVGVVLNVRNCSACGEHHRALEFELLAEHLIDGDGRPWEMKATCPNSGHEVLARVDTVQRMREAK